MNKRLALLLSASLLTMAYSASAETIAECGKSVGKEYAGDPNKWTDADGSFNPQTTIVQVGSDYDVLFRDQLGMRSVRSQQGRVFRVEGADNGRLTLLAVYPLGDIETYQLTLGKDGRGTLLWTSSKHQSFVTGTPVGGLYVAQCTR